eukprot:scaffold1016_cov203-Chaetoceros_neogracile.AAC.3
MPNFTLRNFASTADASNDLRAARGPTTNTYNVVNVFHTNTPPTGMLQPHSSRSLATLPHHSAPPTVDPATYNGSQTTIEELAPLDNSSGLRESFANFIVPSNMLHLSQLITAAQETDLSNKAAFPPTIRDFLINSTMITMDYIQDFHKAILSDPTRNKIFRTDHDDIVEIITNYYLSNPIALAPFFATPQDRHAAEEAGRPFVAPCPICNMHTSAIRDLIDPKVLPTPSPNNQRGVPPPKETRRYLSPKDLKKHCSTGTFASNTNFEAVHRYLSVFIDVIDGLTDCHNLDCQNRGGDPTKKLTLYNLVEEAYASFTSQVPPSAHPNHSSDSDDSEDAHSHGMDITRIHEDEDDDPAAPAVTLSKSQKKRAKKKANKRKSKINKRKNRHHN